MRHRPLHSALRAFADDAATALAREVADGAEVPFELDSGPPTRPRRTQLFMYRPLTGAFIRERLGVLARLETYAPAARALEHLDGLDAYLRARGEQRVPRDSRDRADATLRVFLDRLFDGSTSFELVHERWERAYEELEELVTSRREPSATLVVGLPGLRLASPEVPLADGILLAEADAVPEAPADAAWLGAVDDEPNVLAVVTLADPLQAEAAPERLRRLVRALRLYDAGCVALAPVGWARLDDGPWQIVDLHGGSPARVGDPLTISTEQEDELRAFISLAARRMPRGGELAWALRRFDLAAEREDPAESLTDLLLALRALLEPEGVDSGLLPRRLAALCAHDAERDEFVERIADAVTVERAIVAGLAPPAAGVADVADELTEHLRAVLGDALCGHLDRDLRAAADARLVPAASPAAPATDSP
jgi:hypothetical protein